MIYKVILEPQEEGGYTAFAPAFPGCRSQGETKKEVLSNIKEAIEAYIQSLKKHGETIPQDNEEICDIKVAV